jgi:AbrB family looped-hinge helix DNA binding protein
MNSVTVSPKFQVVIPLSVRKRIGVKPGQKMQVIAYDDKVILIPVRPISEARGSLSGMDTDNPREEDEEERA